MKFKHGDKVRIIKSGFHQECKGIVVRYDQVDGNYQVALDYNTSEWFYDSEMEKTTWTNEPKLVGGK